MSLIRRLLAAMDAVQRRHVVLAFPVAVIRKTSNDQGGSLAALIAYYGFLSMFPLLLVFAAVLGFVLQGDPGLKAEVLHTTERSFPVASGYIETVVAGSGAALGIGLVGALWAGLGVARATERAMNSVWDIPMAERPNLWWSRLRAVAMLCVLGVTFLASTALAGLQQVGGLLALPAHVLGAVGPLVLNFLLYLMAFQVLTNRHLAWRTMIPGATVGAVGWTALQSLGAYFAQHEVAHASHLYGSLAVVIGLLAWLYLGAQLTIYAAQVNVVLTYRLWPRSLVRGVHTDADRRALMRQIGEAQRTLDEVITVHFSITQQGMEPTHAAPSPVGPATDRTRAREVGGRAAGEVADDGRPGAAAPGALVAPTENVGADVVATHVALSVLRGHLEAFDALRQEIDRSPEPTTRVELARRLDVEVAGIAGALRRLADLEDGLARALHEAMG